MGMWGLELRVSRVCMGVFGFGKRNVEDEMILQYYLQMLGTLLLQTLVSRRMRID